MPFSNLTFAIIWQIILGSVVLSSSTTNSGFTVKDRYYLFFWKQNFHKTITHPEGKKDALPLQN